MDELFDITLADKDDEWLCAHKVIMAAICYPTEIPKPVEPLALHLSGA